MPLNMSRPWKHPDSGVYWFRRAVPADLRVLVGKREEKRSLQTKDPSIARRRHAEALAEVEARWANLRGGVRTLSEREAHELAAASHDRWLELYKDNPSEQTTWRVDLGDRLWRSPAIVYVKSGLSQDFASGSVAGHRRSAASDHRDAAFGRLSQRAGGYGTSGERHYKLLLSQTDKASLTAIVASNEQPAEQSVRVTQNFEFFEGLIAARKGDLASICNGLAKLVVVDIALSRDHDNPQLIFESMNSTGRELSQADLIRNFILMGLEPGLQTRLYEQFWRPMEVAFGQEAYNAHFDAFMRHYLTVKTGDIPRLDEVYEAFKQHARSPETAAAGVEALVKDIRDFARYYCAMALGQEPDNELKLAFHDLRELKVDVAYPFLLELYHDYAGALLPKSDLVNAVRL